jgi:hypothetical protein
MSIERRVEKLEQQTDASAGVRCTIIVPPKMSRDEWQAYAREMNSQPGDPFRFTLNLNSTEALDEHTE